MRDLEGEDTDLVNVIIENIEEENEGEETKEKENIEEETKEKENKEEEE